MEITPPGSSVAAAPFCPAMGRVPRPRTHHTRAWLVPVLGCLLLLLTPTPPLAAAADRPTGPAVPQAQPTPEPEERTATSRTVLPPGFVEVPLVDGLDLPTDLVLLPSGAILVAEKGGYRQGEEMAQVRMVRDGILLERPVISLYSQTQGDAGILGMVLDPDFPENRYFYVWYSTGPGAREWSGRSGFRLSRFRLDPILDRADPAEELILLDGVPRKLYHGGGGLAFDGQGRLYISTGENFESWPAQDLGTLNGKILRILPTETGYTIPPDNPYVDREGIPPEIFGLGLRNPFRMTYRAATDTLYIADVGHAEWEEINRALPGANYGWPLREGPCPQGEVEPCAAASDSLTDPLYAYAHPQPEGGSAITGLAFYAGTQYPAEYRQLLYFVDYNRQFIGTLDPDADHVGQTDARHGPDLFAQSAGNLVDIEYYDNSLYTLDIVAGRLSRIDYLGEDAPPAVAVAADRQLGAAPLTVMLSADVVDPRPGETYRYGWLWGDGTDVTETDHGSAVHVYQEDGTYSVQVVVTDTQGRMSQPASTVIDVYSGELPAVLLAIQGEDRRDRYYAGDEVAYRAFRFSDLTDLDPDLPFRWRIDLHHNEHTHPILVGRPGSQGIFQIPRTYHDTSLTLWYEFRLTMRTATGQEVTVARPLLPELAPVEIGLAPEEVAGSLRVDDVTRLAPYTFTDIVGTEHQVSAPTVLLMPTGQYAFQGWQEDGVAQARRTFYSAPAGTTLTARYSRLDSAYPVYIPTLSR